MTVSTILGAVLLLLMVAVGGKKGFKSFVTLCVNFLILFFMAILIAIGFNPLTVTLIGSFSISAMTLFYISGINRKTLAALVSVMLVVVVTLALTYDMAMHAKIQGFSVEQYESFGHLTYGLDLDFSKIVVCVILMGLLGAIIDVAISISSSMNELKVHDSQIKDAALFKSGMNVGTDILGTMTNTLLFAYIGGFMTLLIWFHVYHYSLADILNAKVFVAEAVQILCSGIGIVLVIPVTAATMIWFSRFVPKSQV